MRATINFEADVDRVQQIMWALAFQEMDPLHQAMDFVETAKPHELREGITSALDLIYRVSIQLEQYRDMLASFERSRLETMLPQEQTDTSDLVSDMSGVQATISRMKDFESFVSRTHEETPEEEENDNTEEG